MKELVVLLPGNSYIGPIQDSEVESTEKLITEAVEKHAAWLSLTDSRRAKIFVPSICGFYFREHVETATDKLIKKQTELVEKATNLIKRDSEGEDWKDT